MPSDLLGVIRLVVTASSGSVVCLETGLYKEVDRKRLTLTCLYDANIGSNVFIY